MKKLFYIFLVTVFVNNVACAQKISTNKVPSAVLTAFHSKFPNAKKASWEKENATEFEVNFKLNGEEVSSNFNDLGEWLETETEIEVSELPSKVQLILTSDFEGFKIKEACKIESKMDGNIYEAELKKGKETFEVLFSMDGKVLSKTKL